MSARMLPATTGAWRPAAPAPLFGSAADTSPKAKTWSCPATRSSGVTSTTPAGAQPARQVVAGRGDAVAAEPDVGGHLGAGLRGHGERAELAGRGRRPGFQRGAQEEAGAH